MTSPPPFRLIVTADDFGFGRKVSQGIVRAHVDGPVTATSVMTVTGEGLAASVELLGAAPGLELGLHLVFTGGLAPLTKLDGSGMVDRAGRFWSNGRLWLAAWAGWIDGRAVYGEIVAQAEAFGKAIGRAPAYVDAHHHAHQLPIVREALLAAMADGVLPAVSRVTVENRGVARGVGRLRLKRKAAAMLGAGARKRFHGAGVWANDSYFGMLSDGDLAEGFPWRRQLEAVERSGVVEWVVHPGELDETLIGRDGYVSQRVAELAALTRGDQREQWEGLRPFLTTKSKLKAGVGE